MAKSEVKVALVNPPLLPGMFKHHPLVPLGLAYLTSVLEKAGYEVKVFDCPPLGLKHGELIKMLTEFSPDFVGITCMTMMYPSAVQVATMVKENLPDTIVGVGGPHVTFYDEETLRECPSVDLVVRGEGEQTILEIAACIKEKRKLSNVEGITLRENGKIIRTPERPLIQNLDALPYPAYHLFPMDSYRIYGNKIMPIITSRGCPFQCSFCVTSRMVGKKFRARSPENVVDELEWLVKEHDADAVCFYDDTLTLDKKRIIEICNIIRKRKINVVWDCQTRVDQISLEVLEGMAKAGCQLVSFGVESGSNKVLGKIGKGTTVEQNKKAVMLAKKVGLLVAVSVIIGYPGETVETVNETLKFLWETKPDDVYICFATPYPGTKLRKMIKDMGWEISNDWSKYDTLTPVFKNPELPDEYMVRLRENFYNKYYSPSYILRHLLKNNLYGRAMARTALNHFIWRIRGWGTG
ncbi:MAG: radical SAM protein [Nitrososphaerota archaeon]|nr:B12-binding domain-containing radical SAM protein [Candidatus Bathyarchaeota archaeon]MDW8024017.1 radical SAM protein [Nitrososphaerota archaeon]MDW8040590.1 radical SAM protein [Nitrososphaerota archaeon]